MGSWHSWPRWTQNISTFFGSKMDKTDDNTLTNQPETVTIPSSILLRVMGCWGMGAEAEFVEGSHMHGHEN